MGGGGIIVGRAGALLNEEKSLILETYVVKGRVLVGLRHGDRAEITPDWATPQRIKLRLFFGQVGAHAVGSPAAFGDGTADPPTANIFLEPVRKVDDNPVLPGVAWSPVIVPAKTGIETDSLTQTVIFILHRLPVIIKISPTKIIRAAVLSDGRKIKFYIPKGRHVRLLQARLPVGVKLAEVAIDGIVFGGVIVAAPGQNILEIVAIGPFQVRLVAGN